MPTVISLFDSCVRVVLKSPSLHGRAAAYLPQRIAHYLLYEACRPKDAPWLLAVQNLVTAWPHRELSFDFLANPVCRRSKEKNSLCLKPSEYYGGFVVELQYEACANSIMIGLFQNVLSHLENGIPPALKLVDMRAVKIGSKQGAALLRLVRGEFPGKHASDYVSASDAFKFGRATRRPVLPLNSSGFHIDLYVDLIINSLHYLEACCEAILHPTWFNIVVKGLRPAEMNLQNMMECIHALDCSPVATLLLHGSVSLHYIQAQVSLCKMLQPTNLLLLGCCRVAPFLQVVDHVESLVLESSAFYELSHVQSRCQLKALTAVTDVASSRSQVAKCLFALREGLQYLSLESSPLTGLPLASLGMCQSLRVLSTVSASDGHGLVASGHMQTPRDVFQALSRLVHLEYFEWAEPVNMRTAELLALHSLLLDSLPYLYHFHLGLRFLLLSTTDLEDETFDLLSPVLLALLKGKVGDESCTTFRFSFENKVILDWLNSLRPAVCFKIAKPELFRKKCTQFIYL